MNTGYDKFESSPRNPKIKNREGRSAEKYIFKTPILSQCKIKFRKKRRNIYKPKPDPHQNGLTPKF